MQVPARCRPAVTATPALFATTAALLAVSAALFVAGALMLHWTMAMRRVARRHRCPTCPTSLPWSPVHTCRHWM